jgi:hypothetical protein
MVGQVCQPPYLSPAANQKNKSACGLLRVSGFSIQLNTQLSERTAPKLMIGAPSPTQIESAPNPSLDEDIGSTHRTLFCYCSQELTMDDISTA